VVLCWTEFVFECLSMCVCVCVCVCVGMDNVDVGVHLPCALCGAWIGACGEMLRGLDCERLASAKARAIMPAGLYTWRVAMGRSACCVACAHLSAFARRFCLLLSLSRPVALRARLCPASLLLLLKYPLACCAVGARSALCTAHLLLALPRRICAN
jgi:hypothetical protein